MKWKCGLPRRHGLLFCLVGAVCCGAIGVGAATKGAAPAAAKAHWNQGMRLKKAGKLAAAARQFEMALSVWPDDVEAHWALAWTYAAQGMAQKAAAHFRRVIALAPATTRAEESRKALARLGERASSPAAADGAGAEPSLASAADVLEHCLMAYAGVDTLVARGTYGIDYQCDHPVRRLVPVTLAYQRPSRFRVELHDDIYGSVLASDGKTLVTYLPILKQYTRTEAPPSLSFEPRGVQAFLTGAFFPLPIQFLAARQPLAALRQNQTEARLVSQETLYLGQPPRPVATYHVRIPTTRAPTGTMGVAPRTSACELWIDAATFMIRKCRYEPDPEAVKQNPRYAALGGDGRLFVTETYFGVRVDEPVSDALFTFTPPTDEAKLVDAFQLPGSQLAGADLIGVRAPGFSLRSMEGQRYALSNYLNEPVLLCFWNSGVAGCRELLPLLDKLQQEHETQRLVVLTVTLNLGNHSAELARQLGVQVPVLCDPQGEVTRDYAAFVQPVLVFIDKLGIIRAVLRGAQPERAVREALATIGVS